MSVIAIKNIRHTTNSGSYWSSDSDSGQHGAGETSAAIVFEMPEGVSCNTLHIDWVVQIPNRNPPANRSIYFDVQTAQPGANYTKATSTNNDGSWTGLVDNNPQKISTTITYEDGFNSGGTYYIVVNSSSLCDWFKSGSSLSFNTYSISYNANGGSGAPSAQTKYEGTPLTLSSTIPTKSSTTTNGFTVTFDKNGGNTLSKTSATATDTTSYPFNTWKDSLGNSYAAGDTYSNDADLALTAYYTSSTTKGSVTTATVTKNNTTSSRTVTFNANGGTCSTSSKTSTATVTYTCSGWFTAASGGTKRADAGGSYKPTATETVYAQWKSSTGSYSAVTLPTASRNGYTFKGWSTSSTATSGSTGNYTPANDVTLYAVWEPLATIFTKVNGSYIAGIPYVKASGTYHKGIAVYVKENNEWHLSTRED